MHTIRKAVPTVLSGVAAILIGWFGLQPIFEHQPISQVFAQSNDCQFSQTFTGDASGHTVSNLSGSTPCVNWRITFSTTGTLASSVTFQTSPDGASWTSVPNTICSSSVQPPCILQGANPLTSTTQGMSYFASYGNYVRVTISSSSGSGSLTVKGYGAKGATASFNLGGGGGGTTGPTGPTGPVAPGGNVIAYTANHTLVSGDCGNWLTFNGSNLTLTLANPPPSAACSFAVQNLNTSTTLTVARNSLTINGAASDISVDARSGVTAIEYSTWTDGSNYFSSRGPVGPSGSTGSSGPTGPTGPQGSGGAGLVNPSCTFALSATGCTIDVSTLAAASNNQILIECWTGASTTQTAVAILTYVYTTGSGIVQTAAPTFSAAAAAGYCAANGTGSPGPAGPTGPSGASGSAGYKIESLQVGSPVTVDSTASQTDLLTYTLAANELGPNQAIRVTYTGRFSWTGNPQLIMQTWIGGNNSNKGIQINALPAYPGAEIAWTIVHTCMTASALGAGAVIYCGVLSSAGGTPSGSTSLFTGDNFGGSFTVDTSGTLVLKATVQWGTSSSSNTLTNYSMIVERLN